MKLVLYSDGELIFSSAHVAREIGMEWSIAETVFVLGILGNAGRRGLDINQDIIR